MDQDQIFWNRSSMSRGKEKVKTHSSRWATLMILSGTKLVNHYKLVKRVSGRGQHRELSIEEMKIQNSSYVCMQ